jgi:alpha-glucosidase
MTTSERLLPIDGAFNFQRGLRHTKAWRFVSLENRFSMRIFLSYIRKTSLVLALFAVLGFSLPAFAQKSQQTPWWQHAVFYEIYPRSFADSNNDGVGDLNGITSKLDYLHTLGVDAIWISPCYPSPQFDFGYDVADYQNIDPMYGTLAEFDLLAREAHKRGIRVIMDFVVNHSSSKHPWFLESKSSRTSPRRDWYIWRDGKAPGAPPNNWESDFGGSAWTFDATTGQYYYHYFEAEQPDLNWRNPAVEQAMLDVTRFWHKHGVDGFRLDAVDTLFEDPALKDNPVLPGKNEFGDPPMTNEYNHNLPEVHEELRRLRKVTDANGQVLIGETWTDNIDALKAYYGAKQDELQLPMDFMFTTVNKLSAVEFRKQIGLVESAGEWPVFVISNHDIVRSYTRYGDGKNNEQIAKLMAGMYLTLRGSPILYYGEELGMENHDPTRREDVKDPLGQHGWPEQKGRDGERTPMQWNASLNAGFTRGTPWLPVAPSYLTHNVAGEIQDKQSILSFYRNLIALRHQSTALLDGKYIPLSQSDPNVLAYLRRSGNDTIFVALNFSNTTQSYPLSLSAQGLNQAKRTVLLSTSQAGDEKPGLLQLSPYAVYIARIGR